MDYLYKSCTLITIAYVEERDVFSAFLADINPFQKILCGSGYQCSTKAKYSKFSLSEAVRIIFTDPVFSDIDEKFNYKHIFIFLRAVFQFFHDFMS